MINWSSFKAKFDGKEQKAFESLAYFLFCNEHNIKIGIFRFKNQTGIETEPIRAGKNIVGFQAKYYETPLSSKKSDIIDSIKKAKNKNPELTKIFIYLNKEFGEGKKEKDPIYKKEIEDFAKSLGIEIEWRVPSHIERQLFLPENKYIKEHFFELGKSIIDFINELQRHTEAILFPIHSEINFAGRVIKLDRKEIVNSLLEDDTKQIIILAGNAGVGKTAIIKDFYEKLKNKCPIYLFKAAEFNLNYINELFKQFGDFTISDFLKAHEDENTKYIIIDSAEKLAELTNQEPFLEFVSEMLRNGWKIVFTIRYSYLESLFQLLQFLNLDFKLINIERISDERLIQLSKEYVFSLPIDKKLIELIKIPFYLEQYLKNYDQAIKDINYFKFKKLLWNTKIQNISQTKDNMHLRREECFLKLAEKRANSGKFYIPNSEIGCNNEVLEKLIADEIIQYDENHGGYFITHDVYEEWALERIIERAFNTRCSSKDFFSKIGNSYSIKKAFRSWISEKLLLNDAEIKNFIEEIIIDSSIESHWKDEVLIPVLLSDYSENFFKIFEKELLENNFQLLKKVIFLARTACKEIDDEFFKSLGISKAKIWESKYVFTKPKGKGWEALIEFIFNHLEKIRLECMNIIIPLLHDWNSKNETGETTRSASLIALHLYKRLQESNILWRDKNKKELIQVILWGASEVKEELKSIFEEILKNEWNSHRDPYYDMVKAILTSFEGIFVAKALPKYVLKLADLYWFKESNKSIAFFHYPIYVEQYYCLSKTVHMNYFPASAYQTPIYWLLQFSPKETIDFILNFTNKCVECYVKSGFDSSVKEIKLIIDDKTTVKQYISNALWNMYRGTSSPVTPYLLQSIHMALEKFFLEQAKNTDSKTLESWLLYLLKNSKSASITAVVTSIVLAYPDKTFNIARILFQTKELFFYDKQRQLLDMTEAKRLYAIGYGLNYQHQIYQDERLKTCKDKHRKWDLEDLVRYYQFFRSEETSEEEARNRLKIIWKILDKHYNNLRNKSQESEEDKSWKLFLARMDRRKMDPKVKVKDTQIVIDFNPQIDSELKQYSEESIKKVNALMKYSALKLWATYKFENDEKYKEYKQYEDNIQRVIKETKKIVKNLQNADETYILFNYSIPAYVCAVLIRDYLNELTDEDKEFCKNILLGYATLPLKDDYQYQIHDGVEAAINTLPLLLKIFPSEKGKIKIILLLTLFDPYPIGNYKRLLDYSAEAITSYLWDISFEDAKSIFLGYLLLRPQYDKLVEETRRENYKKGIYQLSKEEIIKKFREKYKSDLERLIKNELKFEEIKNLEQLNLEILEVAFALIPADTQEGIHKNFIKRMLSIFAKAISQDNGKIDYGIKQRFLKKFAYFILNRKKDEIKEFIQPFVNNFAASQGMVDFFQEVIFAEDVLNTYEQFWIIWESFYEKIVNISRENSYNHYKNEVIRNYLLALPYWKETAKEWRSLKDRERLFFKRITEDIGHCSIVLYSIAKLLNGIGSKFMDDGILWISDMLEKNKNLWKTELKEGTIYFLENIVRRYCILNGEKIKKNVRLKEKILILLDFLVEKGSTIGFLIREEIF